MAIGYQRPGGFEMPDGEWLDLRALIGHVVWHLCPICETWDGSYVPDHTYGRICGHCHDGRLRTRERGPVEPIPPLSAAQLAALKLWDETHP